MQKKILNLNNENYQFSLSVLSESDWEGIVQGIVVDKCENVLTFELLSLNIVIRANKAKMKICFQDSSYHEILYHLDEFGRSSKDYRDIASFLLQEEMSGYYGKEYSLALNNKLNAGVSQ